MRTRRRERKRAAQCEFGKFFALGCLAASTAPYVDSLS
jgi:hypothetical protein